MKLHLSGAEILNGRLLAHSWWEFLSPWAVRSRSATQRRANSRAGVSDSIFLPMKIAVVGLGFMGLTHIRAIQGSSVAELGAVVSRDQKKLEGDLSGIQGNIGGPGQKFDFSGIGRYRSLEEALKDPQIEAVDICLPTRFHAEAAVKALEAGKHVLVEKPMALTEAEAERMIETARKVGRVLMVAQVLRFWPAYKVLREKLQSGELGKVKTAILRRRCAAPTWSTWLMQKEVSGGGVFDLLVHDVDFCIHAFGPPKAISAIGYEDLRNGIDWVTATLHYEEIPAVVISGGWHHPGSYPFSMEYTIVAEAGTVEYHSASVPTPTWYKPDGGKVELAQEKDTDAYRAEIEYFVGCCERGQQPVFCPPEESALAVRLSRLLDEARAKKGEKVSCVN